MMKTYSHLVLLALCCSMALVGVAQAQRTAVSKQDNGPARSYANRPDVRAFAQEVAERRRLDVSWVETQLAQAQYQQSAKQQIMPAPAGTAKDWAAYRSRFVEAQRVQAGARFWHEHDEWLNRAEDRYGVPAEIVVGIIGVETFYGRITGNFRVLDALATLAFDFPVGRSDRSPFFRSELEEFLVMCQREGLDATQVKGSFAGAIGLPQFMPSNINRFAVDFDADGHIDLQNNPADVIGSVARYLAEHGWVRGMTPYFSVAVPVDSRQRATLLQPDILPSFSAGQMQELGAALDSAGRAHDGLLALVELQNGTAAPSFVAGTQNFFALTRYNQSSYYAMAVIALGQAIKRQR